MISEQEQRAKAAISKAMEKLDPDQRESVLKRLKDKYDPESVVSILNADIQQAEREHNAAQARLAAQLAPLHERKAALERLKPWVDLAERRLERNDAGRLHKLVEAHAAGKIIDQDGSPLPPEHAPWLLSAQPFVVEHDWAAAFANATDYSDGDFRLPFQECAFEFRISGRTVITVAFQPDPEVLHEFPDVKTSMPTMIYVDCGGGWWFCAGDLARTASYGVFAWDQMRAISIALDAEVATREVIRASVKLNEKRTKDGKVPLYDYHVVRLHGRAVRQQMPSQHGTHRSPRLHFRRGHWRHYQTHKTWIRWTLVGDPSLGFIDKSYRL